MSLLLLVSHAVAGERVFAWSYSYGTVPQGGIEVEHYLTAEVAPASLPSWTHQVELEYGITDQLEGGLYLVGKQAGGDAFSFSGYKGRLKYRFGAEGVGPIDVAAYLEYQGTPTAASHAVEAKAILGKTVGKLDTAVNLEYKAKFGDGAVAHTIEPLVGVGWHVVPAFLIGAEGKVEMELEGDEVEGPYAWAGPTIHVAGKGGRLWWTLAGLLPLTAETAADEGFAVRSLLAINL